MARITVEDCLENVENRFQLVLVAAKRAHELANGHDSLVDRENDKPTVIALREVAEGLVTPAILEKSDDEFEIELTEAQRALDMEIAEVMTSMPADEAMVQSSATEGEDTGVDEAASNQVAQEESSEEHESQDDQ